eukprot:PhM_4_TR14642/c0_g1_i1/m.62162
MGEGTAKTSRENLVVDVAAEVDARGVHEQGLGGGRAELGRRGVRGDQTNVRRGDRRGLDDVLEVHVAEGLTAVEGVDLGPALGDDLVLRGGAVLAVLPRHEGVGVAAENLVALLSRRDVERLRVAEPADAREGVILNVFPNLVVRVVLEVQHKRAPVDAANHLDVVAEAGEALLGLRPALAVAVEAERGVAGRRVGAESAGDCLEGVLRGVLNRGVPDVTNNAHRHREGAAGHSALVKLCGRRRNADTGIDVLDHKCELQVGVVDGPAISGGSLRVGRELVVADPVRGQDDLERLVVVDHVATVAAERHAHAVGVKDLDRGEGREEVATGVVAVHLSRGVAVAGHVGEECVLGHGSLGDRADGGNKRRTGDADDERARLLGELAGGELVLSAREDAVGVVGALEGGAGHGHVDGGGLAGRRGRRGDVNGVVVALRELVRDRERGHLEVAHKVQLRRRRERDDDRVRRALYVARVDVRGETALRLVAEVRGQGVVLGLRDPVREVRGSGGLRQATGIDGVADSGDGVGRLSQWDGRAVLTDVLGVELVAEDVQKRDGEVVGATNGALETKAVGANGRRVTGADGAELAREEVVTVLSAVVEKVSSDDSVEVRQVTPHVVLERQRDLAATRDGGARDTALLSDVLLDRSRGGRVVNVDAVTRHNVVRARDVVLKGRKLGAHAVGVHRHVEEVAAGLLLLHLLGLERGVDLPRLFLVVVEVVLATEGRREVVLGRREAQREEVGRHVREVQRQTAPDVVVAQHPVDVRVPRGGAAQTTEELASGVAVALDAVRVRRGVGVRVADEVTVVVLEGTVVVLTLVLVAGVPAPRTAVLQSEVEHSVAAVELVLRDVRGLHEHRHVGPGDLELVSLAHSLVGRCHATDVGRGVVRVCDAMGRDGLVVEIVTDEELGVQAEHVVAVGVLTGVGHVLAVGVLLARGVELNDAGAAAVDEHLGVQTESVGRPEVGELAVQSARGVLGRGDLVLEKGPAAARERGAGRGRGLAELRVPDVTLLNDETDATVAETSTVEGLVRVVRAGERCVLRGLGVTIDRALTVEARDILPDLLDLRGAILDEDVANVRVTAPGAELATTDGLLGDVHVDHLVFTDGVVPHGFVGGGTERDVHRRHAAVRVLVAEPDVVAAGVAVGGPRAVEVVRGVAAAREGRAVRGTNVPHDSLETGETGVVLLVGT